MHTIKSTAGRSPLTDPRSLMSSLLFHGLLIVVASAVALGVAAPERPELPKTLRGELEPVDNRAPAKEGGGAPGELGGTGVAELVPRADGAAPDGASRASAADTLVSEIIPSQGTTDATQSALPGPQTTGVGVLPGPGTGGGGGSGGGSGGGVGRGIGPGTEFFGARERAGSFAYVIDCSGSMATRGSLDIAKRELMASLGQLPPDAQFGVIFYNLQATVFSDPLGRNGLMAATASNKERVRSQLKSVIPDGGTDHMLALQTAFALHAEVVFFLTDADLMTNSDVDELLRQRGKSRIQAIEFGRGAGLAGDRAPLSRLATSTGGSYRYIDVTKFPQRPQ